MSIWLKRAYAACASSLVVALAARFGYSTADAEVDRVIAAVTLGFVSLFGLLSHGWAIQAWRHSKFWAGMLIVIGLPCMVVSIGTNLGAIATRGDKGAAERGRVAVSVDGWRTDATRMRKQLDALPATTAPSETAKASAEAAVATAEAARKAECDRRGQFCRDREVSESQRRQELAALLNQIDTAKSRSEIEGAIVTIEGKISAAPPAVTRDPQAKAIARLVGIDETDAAIWIALAIALVLELSAAVSFAAAEAESASLKDKSESEKPQPSVLASLPVAPVTSASPASVQKVVAPPVQRSTNVVQLSPRKRDLDAEAVRFGEAVLRPADGNVHVEDLYDRYLSWCPSHGITPAAPDEIGPALKRLLIGTCGLRLHDGRVHGVALVVA